MISYCELNQDSYIKLHSYILYIYIYIYLKGTYFLCKGNRIPSAISHRYRESNGTLLPIELMIKLYKGTKVV